MTVAPRNSVTDVFVDTFDRADVDAAVVVDKIAAVDAMLFEKLVSELLRLRGRHLPLQRLASDANDPLGIISLRCTSTKGIFELTFEFFLGQVADRFKVELTQCVFDDVHGVMMRFVDSAFTPPLSSPLSILVGCSLVAIFQHSRQAAVGLTFRSRWTCRFPLVVLRSSGVVWVGYQYGQYIDTLTNQPSHLPHHAIALKL